MSLFDSFKDVYDKVFTTEAINVDHIVFKLHYRVTVTILVVVSVILGLGQVSIKNVLFHCNLTNMYTKRPQDFFYIQYKYMFTICN